jgi:hypothetical protein
MYMVWKWWWCWWCCCLSNVIFIYAIFIYKS